MKIRNTPFRWISTRISTVRNQAQVPVNRSQDYNQLLRLPSVTQYKSAASLTVKLHIAERNKNLLRTHGQGIKDPYTSGHTT